MTAQATLRCTVVGLFPEMLRAMTDASILGRAQKQGILVLDEVQIRDFADDKHRSVDDTPCGGGPGMILKPDVLLRAVRFAAGLPSSSQATAPGTAEVNDDATRRIVLLDPAGKRFGQADANRYASLRHLILVCGRYEGVDARVYPMVDEIVSIGDYVLTGGELAAAVILDATARQIKGVLGNDESTRSESHMAGILEHRQYTRPIVHDGQAVPTVLLEGNHARIEKARRKDALLRTRRLRPDLFAEPLAHADQALVDDVHVPTLDPSPVPNPISVDDDAQKHDGTTHPISSTKAQKTP
jgi:tRNA (guanine37-N1)-methyltransferase